MIRNLVGLWLFLIFTALYAEAMPFASFSPLGPKAASANLRQNVIFRGTPVAPGGESWKFTVQIWSSHSLCTGVVVAANLILTAAHCQDSAAQVTMLTFFRGEEVAHQKMYQPSDYVFINNPDYASSVAHDFGFLVFKQKILPNDSYHAIDFLSAQYLSSLDPGKEAFLVGAGRVGVAKEKETYTKLNFITGKIQKYVGGGFGAALESPTNTGICHGDSGGPMLVKIRETYYLAGLNSQMAIDFPDQACNHRFFISLIDPWVRRTFLHYNASESPNEP